MPGHLPSPGKMMIIGMARALGKAVGPIAFFQEFNLATSETIQFDARVIKALPNAQFLVEADAGGAKHEVLAHISGKMRKNFIRIVPGDVVTVEVSPYDLSRGRIVYRQR